MSVVEIVDAQVHTWDTDNPQYPWAIPPRAQFEQQSLRDEPAAVMTWTSDWLSYYPAPPLYVGFVQFRNGARLSIGCGVYMLPSMPRATRRSFSGRSQSRA